ncbi:MAG TPA: hypothetical protein VK506_04415 [Conexibacter sp.]|nr:hypothetical protein [Conexibacter sp.]
MIGSFMRTSPTRVIGSVVLLRAKGTRGAVSARRSLRVVVGGPVASIVTQRNVLRRRAPRSAGARAAGGEAPLFCATNEGIVDGAYRSYDHGEFLGVDFGGYRLKSEVRYEPDVPALAYGLYCDVYRPDLTPLLTAIGSRFPVSCTFTGTYIGAATDSGGNVLTEPSFVWGLQCSKTIDELALVVYEGYVKYCEDAADRPCSITTTTTQRDTALFQYRLPANMDWSVTIGGDPPLMRGGKIDLVIDLANGGQVRDEQVM